MNFAIFILFLAILGKSSCGECPMIYKRLSKDHTFCMASTCKVIAGGSVSDSDKETILKAHNELRNKLATGKETQYQTLPSAANMMQLEWDDELAAIAQAHANQCKFQHDRGDQRAVGNFSVGQNLLQMMGTLSIDWEKVKIWYTSEVEHFRPEYNKPFQFQGSYGHFSQVIWAKTWKIGCGVAGYTEANTKKVLYTCNYGPAGNMIGSEAYQVGSPCSACPENTKCSEEYTGLCKSLTANGPQVKAPSTDDYLLYCQFSDKDSKKCKDVKISGTKAMEDGIVYSGKYKTGVFNAGEKVKINFGKFQHKNGICAYLIGRFGPNDASEKPGSFVSFEFSAPGLIFPKGMKTSRTSSSWNTIGILMKSDREMEVTYTFEVKKDATPQYFEFKEYGVRGGKCP